MSALPGWWRWMAGMKIWRLSGADGKRHFNRLTEMWPEPEDVGYMPCEDDSATRGCLTDLVREMWGDPGLFARPRIGGPGWVVIGHARVLLIDGETEWTALMAAGDAAWARRGGAS